MGGIVSTSIDKYMRVLLEHNYTVVLVEQLNPNPPCKRAVTGFVLPLLLSLILLNQLDLIA